MSYGKTVGVLAPVVAASSGHAEEWPATLKVTNGQGECGGDGVVVNVKEGPGLLQTTAMVSSHPRGQARSRRQAHARLQSDFFDDMKVPR